MNIVDLQKAVGAKPDGIWGEKSRAALISAFTNPHPAKLSADEAQKVADRLGVSVKQLAAVAAVEAGGAGFDASGKPKILFERHKFHTFTGGRYSVSTFSNPLSGGYETSSWDKLVGAIVTGSVDAAFMSCSWGKFQVMGEYWAAFHYDSPFALAFSTVASEATHYELLCRYIEHNHLQDEMKAISSDPETCRAFAKGYNGEKYGKYAYHTKLAAHM